MKLLHWVSLGAVLLTSSASFGQALEAARFGISIDGQSASVIGFNGGEAPGAAAKATSTPLKVTVDRSGSDAMWQWIATSLNQGPVEKKIEGQAKGKRRATFSSATISEVKFDDFDANASKKPMRVTVTVVPKQIVAAVEAGKSKQEPAAKSWSPASFRVKVGGIPLAKVHKIESFTIKQKVTESGKAAYEVTDMRIKLDGGSRGRGGLGRRRRAAAGGQDRQQDPART
jgi:hypothetical protein